MSADLKYLAFTAILTASLWIPYVVAQVMTNGPLTPPNYVDPAQRPLPPWGKRGDRVSINAIETLRAFCGPGDPDTDDRQGERNARAARRVILLVAAGARRRLL